MFCIKGNCKWRLFAGAVSSVYTFGPTFHAENSKTSRHLAEFWMVEPEIAFAELKDHMNCTEAYMKFLCNWLLDNCLDDMEFLAKNYDKGCINRLRMVLKILLSNYRHLTEVIFQKPVIVYNNPKGIKAFYMRLNDDGKTTAAMDVLAPKVGKLIGGSQIEERYAIIRTERFEP
ncbi:hypothetical protein CRG98_013516 [Punica granatum]|uniref:Aminoacyl-tRNA synthetase class II (D/K/N) domain-containing protein n=1 Tax=Punica granatum TaxID=22663 RepID=A0A2I0KC56_PUNGR|nr:hypothetical protein CRG98_013516 [Punica granatum]